MITFVCVQAQNYGGMGARYVNTLLAMVQRNVTQPFKFKCLTDDDTGLDPGIGVLQLPADLEGWWGKLYLFKRGVFPDGERIVFLDLDTLIVGNIDDICAYDGTFATLIDFYWPHLIGPGVMLWRPCDYTYAAWDAWETAGRPRHTHGDWWWLNTFGQGVFAANAGRLQLLYPEAFISWKIHCRDGVNPNSKVICFHGPEKPHNTEHPFIAEVWK